MSNAVGHILGLVSAIFIWVLLAESGRPYPFLFACGGYLGGHAIALKFRTERRFVNTKVKGAGLKTFGHGQVSGICIFSLAVFLLILLVQRI